MRADARSALDHKGHRTRSCTGHLPLTLVVTLTLAVPLTLAASTLANPGTASAQQSASGDPGARELFGKGKAAYSVGNYEDAIRDWRQAYALDPKPLILFNIAQALERLGKLQEAVQSYQTYLDRAPADTDTYSEVTAKLATLRQRLANTGVLIEGALDGSQITVDGKGWGVTPRPDKIALSPGSHRIVLSQTGYRDYVSNLVIPAGQVIKLQVEMEAEARGAEDGAPPPGQPPVSEATPNDASQANATANVNSTRTTHWTWVIAGGTGAAVGVGALLYANERHAQVQECNREGWYCYELDAVKSERTLGLVTGAALLVGGAGAIVYGLMFGEPGESPSVGDTACVPVPGGATCTLHF